MSIFEEGLRLSARHARAVRARARIGELGDPEDRGAPFEDVTLSNAVPGQGVGLPAYFTTSGMVGAGGGAWSLLPDNPLAYFAAVTLGIAIAGGPSWYLAPRIGSLKGHLVGVSISGAVLTALWYWQKKRVDAMTETKKPGDRP